MPTPTKFYKYMKTDAAKIVLTNGTLRWSQRLCSTTRLICNSTCIWNLIAFAL